MPPRLAREKGAEPFLDPASARMLSVPPIRVGCVDSDDRDFDANDQAGHGFEPYAQEGESLLSGGEPSNGSAGPAVPRVPALRSRPDAPAAPLALYRRYRPDTFAEVIGQQHVTDPLQRALTSNRVNHAYLFSGPRGCGKTTSARILARCLNCAQGPTATPCGKCPSCRDLARGGPGSIDVIEIDAASHGGVDDARDLRERAFFSPVNSRYKIYIVDEAHMVTTAGFNALLKLVEEPPPHVKFVFATTEPEKVIGTIRSRTHHYPFRLVPPKTLQAYLLDLCEAEGIAVEPTVLPLVVRAGAGSVRDSLSVLDQLLGGATDSGVSYANAAALLGYTPDSLLNEIVDAFAAGDAAGVFACIDKVIEVGQDPHRFGEDLLRRLRDLLIVAAVPDAVASGLVEVADDQAERLISQAAALGRGELTRAAEVMATGLTDMRGTTAPRLHLELMCARVLLPGADVDERGFHARLDRLERRLAGLPLAPVDAGGGPRDEGRHADSPPPAPDTLPGGRTTPANFALAESVPPSEIPHPANNPSAPPGAGVAGPSGHPSPTPQAAGAEPRRTAGSTGAGSTGGGSTGGGLRVADVRRMWPDVLEEVKTRRRFTWILLSQNAQVVDVHDGVLTLALKNAGARDHFAKSGNEDVLRDAIVEVLRADLKIETLVEGGPPGAPAPGIADSSHRDSPHGASPSPGLQAPADMPEVQAPGSTVGDRDADGHREASAAADRSPASPPDAPEADATQQRSPKNRLSVVTAPERGRPGVSTPSPGAALARGRILATRRQTSGGLSPDDEPAQDPYDEFTDAESEPDSQDLLARHLGAELISEQDTKP